MVKMISTKPHKFQGRDRVIGDEYEASPGDRDMLRKLGWAKDHVERKTKSKHVEPVKADPMQTPFDEAVKDAAEK